MIRIAMTKLMLAAFCLALVCAGLRAQAQANEGVSEETNPGVEAIDASVHAEVDGQPQEAIPADLSSQRITLGSTTRHPATTFWLTHADVLTADADGKGGPPKIGFSSFRPKTASGQPNPPQPSESATAGGAKNNDSTQAHFRVLNVSPSHPLALSAKSSLIRKTTIPPISEPDQTTALSAPFGRAAFGLGASASPFPKKDSFEYKNQATGKRRAHHARKPRTSTAIKSSFDSLATTRH
jgi:hypothetical protein